MTWVRTQWSDPVIKADDWGGTRVRLLFPDGTIVIGKVTVAPNSIFRQNDKVVMARITTLYSGDTWINVQEADVFVWESTAWGDAMARAELAEFRIEQARRYIEANVEDGKGFVDGDDVLSWLTTDHTDGAR